MLLTFNWILRQTSMHFSACIVIHQHMHYAFLMDRTWNEMRDLVEGVSTFIQAGKRRRNIIPVYKDFFLLRLTTFKYHSNLYFLLYRTSLLRIKNIYIYICLYPTEWHFYLQPRDGWLEAHNSYQLVQSHSWISERESSRPKKPNSFLVQCTYLVISLFQMAC